MIGHRDGSAPATGVGSTIQMARKRKTLMSQEAYDIVIVGAGAAGCVVASYLAKHTDA